MAIQETLWPFSCSSFQPSHGPKKRCGSHGYLPHRLPRRLRAHVLPPWEIPQSQVPWEYGKIIGCCYIYVYFIYI